ncbi:hypothetical protein [Microbulbifer taiwanensis]|uniref:hypothetical protein n=1 Tax=Microbulbifer taiwanensis TaxID=986746 RepID=UPI0036158B54
MASIPAIKAAISDLDIEQRVERDVKAGIPEVDRNSHTESEESLRAYVVREIIGKVHQGRQAEIDQQANTRGEVEIRQLYQQIRNTEAALDKKVSAKISAVVQMLQRMAREFSAARMDLESFRHRNGLTRRLFIASRGFSTTRSYSLSLLQRRA